MSTKLPREALLHARAPTRIDLAGGTIDLWPLYLLVPKAQTINLGIDLFAETWVTVNEARSGSGGVVLSSDDQNHERAVSWDQLFSVEVEPQLRLHQLVAAYRLEPFQEQLKGLDLKVRTLARSPAGAGLGGSSALGISILGAFDSWLSGTKRPDVAAIAELIPTLRDLETQILKIPAGVQDYYGAVYGGLQRLQWGVRRPKQTFYPEGTLAGLVDRLELFYSGTSRNSGLNNWQLFKSLVDQQSGVPATFGSIAQATEDLHQALVANHWEAVGAAISDEWTARRTLASGIVTPDMNKGFEKIRRIGIESVKVCGAGGGGCFFAYHPNWSEDLRSKVRQTLEIHGCRRLPFRAVAKGLELSSSLWPQ